VQVRLATIFSCCCRPYTRFLPQGPTFPGPQILIPGISNENRTGRTSGIEMFLNWLLEKGGIRIWVYSS